MIRKIIHIDAAACNGCGACVTACHEGAIELVDGKARLTREHYCDGLGDCLPACPTGAITFEEREAPAYDEAAVLAEKARKHHHHGGGCPGSRAMAFQRDEAPAPAGEQPSRLRQWPVQIQLAPIHTPYFDGCDLLVAADCTAFAYGAFHEKLLNGKIVLVGCPKLDAVQYEEKLEGIFRANDIRTVTVARMEVPCCGGLERAVRTALERSGKAMACHVVTISTDGRIL